MWLCDLGLCSTDGVYERAGGSCSPSSRPSSAGSLSHYSILPAIGSTKPGRPYASPPSPHLLSPRQTSPIQEQDGLDDSPIPKQDGSNDSPIQELDKLNDSPSQKQDGSDNSPIQELHKLNDSPSPELDGLNARGDTSDSLARKHSDGKEEENEKCEVLLESDTTFQQLTRNIALPQEPHGDELKILLAVKLPDGRRMQRNFNPSDTLQTVLNFAAVSASLDLTGCDLVCSMPMQVFHNKGMTIKESGLKNRTMLHVENPDD